MLRNGLLLAFLLAAVVALPQSDKARRDSLRARISALKAELPAIDSAGPLARAIEARLELAAIVAPKEAVGYLTTAAALADSMGDPWIGIEARTRLMERHRAAGDSKRALAEALRIIDLERECALADAERHSRDLHDLAQVGRLERDSLAAANAVEAAASRTALNLANERIALGRNVLAGVVAIAAVLLAATFLLLRRAQRKERRRLSDEVASLRAQVATLSTNVAELQATTTRTSSTAAPQPPAETRIATEPPAPAPVLDPMILALFKRQAPERIVALQAARTAGDHEKVLRVLHSLRPQLEALDPAGLGALGARLRGMGGEVLGAGALLDEFVADVETLLR